jgi:acetolactate synthase-1/2/3 large subunit
MSTIKGAKAIIESLKREGVDHVFALPGTTVLDLFDALYDDKEITLIVSRHEQGAVFMADGYTRASGRPSVCMASRGPGALNMAIGVHNAFMESSPVVVLIGQVGQDVSFRDAFEEIDVIAAFRPFTKWAVEIQRAERIPELVQRAVRTARIGRPRPVVISIPMNLQREDIDARFWPETNSPRPRAALQDVEAVVDRIVNSAFPVILAGNGVNSAGANDPLVKFSELLDIPVVSTWGRNDVFPNDHPLFLGAAGFGAAKVTSDYLMKADLIVAIGCRFSEFTTTRYRFPHQGTSLVTIDIEGEGLSRVYSPTIGIVSDARSALEDLLTVARTRVRPDDLERMKKTRDKEVRKARRAFSAASKVPDGKGRQGYVHPGVLVQSIQKAVREDTIIVTDAGSLVTWVARYYQFKRPGTLLAPAGGAMGFGLPAAIGAQMARPDRNVIAIVGDGAFMMVLQELETAVRYKIPVVVVVMNNFCFANVKEKQMREYGGRVIGSDYTNPDFAQLARLFGARGERIETAEEVVPAIVRALHSDVPSVLDVMVDPRLALPPVS